MSKKKVEEEKVVSEPQASSGWSKHATGFAVGIGLTGLAIGAALMIQPNDAKPLSKEEMAILRASASEEDQEEIV